MTRHASSERIEETFFKNAKRLQFALLNLPVAPTFFLTDHFVKDYLCYVRK